MRRLFFTPCFLYVVTSLMTASDQCQAQDANSARPTVKRPQTKSEPVTDVLHGEKIVDPYRWLEDQQSPATREWIKQQNVYTDAMLKDLQGQDKITARLGQLMKVDAVGLPHARAGRYFFMKRRADQDLAVICFRKGVEGADEVLIDPANLSDDGSKSVSIEDISEDGKLLVYTIRTGGEDEVAIHLFDVDARKDLADALPRARYFGATLTPDKKTIFYTKHDDDGPRVFKHTVGDDLANNKQIFGDGYDSGKILYATLSHGGQYLIFHVLYGSAAPKSDLYFLDLTDDGPVRPIVNDIDARFFGAAINNRLFVRTNWEASNGRILEIDLENPQRANWREVIPRSEAVIEDFSLCGGKLFVNYLDNVKSRVSVYDPSGEHVRDVEFPALGSVSAVYGEWESDEAFFSYSSFHIPSTIYRDVVSTGERSVWARLAVPVDSDNFQLEQVFITSKDGTRVPMFLLYGKGTKLDGKNPTLLYGYGGFNVSLTPSFSARAVSWVEQGGVYAVANLRGGGELGEQWHEAGMLENKQNVFDDFYAAARWLIDRGYTNPDRLAIAGGSNGGLLVGAAMTQHPELFRAVVCSYPLLDMLRYHQFLVARFWVPEYGSSEDLEQFEVLRAYSPYHNVKPGTKYPALMLITGDSDTRVDPLHARKMAALMQASSTDDRPMLLHYDTKAGHSRGRPVSTQIEDLAYELGFLFDQLGVKVK
ncbi:Prolyl endopeptidase [Symmachiella macrocystis]|uniref:prolyl oligopeptidase n=1 Tax=Symmachiella macrocystis TaxID=2527985 RepID=A0A5C6BEB2_9PLAN|nr:prolyl oligopeptidase family serine peptidase [Symmachiella macrocystis]TWU09609.1 Prolyl endopeptidase [Symmachiella macrocystis]